LQTFIDLARGSRSAVRPQWGLGQISPGCKRISNSKITSIGGEILVMFMQRFLVLADGL